MPKDMVNAYGIEDVETGKSQEITINDCFQKRQHSSNTYKHEINSRIGTRLKTTPQKTNIQKCSKTHRSLQAQIPCCCMRSVCLMFFDTDFYVCLTEHLCRPWRSGISRKGSSAFCESVRDSSREMPVLRKCVFVVVFRVGAP